ncbi:MAG: hypothetical protein L0Z50_19270 [Verrucomicrobiales bacterium]|nr:hypothetical protein [Verrucomicrobiales bacterium]
MKFSELVRLLEHDGFRLVKEKGSHPVLSQDWLAAADSYSPDLEGFSGVGHSVEDCLYKARSGIEDHIKTLYENRLTVPPANPNPTVVIKNEDKFQPV